MSRPGRALGRLHRPVLTVVIPLDGDVPDTGSGLEGVADAVSLTASAPREAGVAALAPTSDGVEPTIRSVLGQSLGDLEVLAVAGAPGAGGRVSPAVSAARHLAEQDRRVRVMPEAGIAAAMRSARASVLTVLSPHEIVADGSYEAMISQLAASGSQAVIGAVRPPGSADAPGGLPTRSRAQLVDVLDAVEEPLPGRILARTRLWRLVSPDDLSVEATTVRVLISAPAIDVLDRCVLVRPVPRGVDDLRWDRSVARARALAEATEGAPALRSRLLGAWMRDEVVDMAVRAVGRSSEYLQRLRTDAGSVLPGASDAAWELLPLLDRALVWVLAHGTRADLEELVGSRIEDTTSCPIQLTGDPHSPLHAIPPVLDRIAALPVDLLVVRSSDMRLIVAASSWWRTPYCLEINGLAYVRGLSAEDAGSLFIEAFDDDGALVAKGRAMRRRAPEADIDADDPWHSHVEEGFTAALWLAEERCDGKRVRLRAALTVAGQVTASWLPDAPRAGGESSGQPHAAGTAAMSRTDSTQSEDLTVDSACIEDGLLTLEGRAPRTPGRIFIAAHSRQGDYELVNGRCRPGTWRATVDLYDASLASGDHALIWSAGPGRSGACLAGAFLSATPVELTGQARSVRLRAGADRHLVLTVMAPLTTFERSRYGRAQLVSRDPGPLRKGIVFESFGGRSVGDNPAAILADLRVHGPKVPMWWTVMDGAMSAPPGSTPVVRGSRAWFQALRTARVIVTNDHLPDWFYKRPGQRIVQTWHGTPIRRILLDAPPQTVSLPYRRLMARQAPQWDLLLAQSDAAAHDLRSSTAYTGRILVGEQPRNVALLADEEERHRIGDELGISPGSRVVLYAPAWDGPLLDGGAVPQQASPLDPTVLAAHTDATVLVRDHCAKRGSWAGTRRATVIDVDDYPSAESLMLVSDVLVSDYSSIIFDYALTGRPTVLYTPDLDRDRGVERGVYRGWPENSGLPVALTQADLIERVREALCDVRDGEPDRLIDPAPILRTLERVRTWIFEALADEI